MHAHVSHGGRKLPTAEAVELLLQALRSDRRVRQVVTRSGRRARGHFPSFKGKSTKYETLVEEDALRVLEIAPSVLVIKSQPFVLRLVDDMTGKAFDYTPDAFIRHKDTAAIVEMKGDWLLQLPEHLSRMRTARRVLRDHGVPAILLLESEIRENNLQEELKQLLRVRPIGARRHERVDASLWDPLGREQASGEMLKRWRDAQRQCDALLDRAMRRDPDEIVEVAVV